LARSRQLARSDLFFLLTHVLGRADLDRDWYFARCREVQRTPNGHLDLWAREHRKSSLITFGLTIQDILNDPEITVAIFSYSRPIAKAFLRQIKVEFETNEMLRSLFPDILWANPQRDAPKFSEDDGIIVRRKGNRKESTVEAWGLVDSTPVSKHFVPPACNQRGQREQGRSIRFKRKLVGPAKPMRREGPDDRVEVRLTGSTPRSGEPATWGSGQR
jgi:hypothetical protein